MRKIRQEIDMEQGRNDCKANSNSNSNPNPNPNPTNTTDRNDSDY
jgi:hypothetical protein